jgi:uncharacterized protein (DUF1697 family)
MANARPSRPRHVALLRGINVGGKNKLAMADLAAAFREAGCGDVQTYIQSGNVLFTAPPALARRIPAAIARALRDGFGLEVPVVVRSAAELCRVVETNPFAGRRGVVAAAFHVAFLADRPPARRVAALDPQRSPGDEFRVLGREVYLCCPGGIGRTKLTNAWFDAGLGTTSTLRNWNTVVKLAELVVARG